MEVFSEAFEKSVNVLHRSSLPDDFSAIERALRLLLNTDGPDGTYAVPSVDALRAKLSNQASGTCQRLVEKVFDESNRPASPVGATEILGLVKTMLHLYLSGKVGAQQVWVFDPPKCYSDWIYDRFNGIGRHALLHEFKETEEVFGSGNRKMMAESLLLTRKWCTDIQIKLAMGGQDVLTVVGRWFCDSETTSCKLEQVTERLLTGFKQMTAACNGNRIIFSDLPQERAGFNEENTIAVVTPDEPMCVIYLFEAFLKIGRRDRFGVIPKLWLCALTVIHELSHKFCGTVDHRYDYKGLRVGASFPASKAISNADSWAYFAADLVGALPEAAKSRALSK